MLHPEWYCSNRERFANRAAKCPYTQRLAQPVCPLFTTHVTEDSGGCTWNSLYCQPFQRYFRCIVSWINAYKYWGHRIHSEMTSESANIFEDGMPRHAWCNLIGLLVYRVMGCTGLEAFDCGP